MTQFTHPWPIHSSSDCISSPAEGLELKISHNPEEFIATQLVLLGGGGGTGSQNRGDEGVGTGNWSSPLQGVCLGGQEEFGARVIACERLWKLQTSMQMVGIIIAN